MPRVLTALLLAAMALCAWPPVSAVFAQERRQHVPTSPDNPASVSESGQARKLSPPGKLRRLRYRLPDGKAGASPEHGPARSDPVWTYWVDSLGRQWRMELASLTQPGRGPRLRRPLRILMRQKNGKWVNMISGPSPALTPGFSTTYIPALDIPKEYLKPDNPEEELVQYHITNYKFYIKLV